MKKTKPKMDLSGDDPLEHDMSEFIKNANNWQWVTFEFNPKNKTVTIRMSGDLLKALKKKAKESGLDYQKFIRLKVEEGISSCFR